MNKELTRFIVKAKTEGGVYRYTGKFPSVCAAINDGMKHFREYGARTISVTPLDMALHKFSTK